MISLQISFHKYCYYYLKVNCDILNYLIILTKAVGNKLSKYTYILKEVLLYLPLLLLVK